MVPRAAGAQVLAASEENGLEGVVAKRLDSPYRPGVPQPDWRKIKNFRTQAVVVGGWRPGQGRRAGGIGSLLVGVPDDEGRLVYAGHVGTGFTRPGPARPQARCSPPRRTSPFEGTLPRDVTRTRTGSSPIWSVRSPTRCGRRRAGCGTRSGAGVRDDLEPDDVVVEP